MNIVTIPKKLAKNDDLVVIPRSEYEALLNKKSGSVSLTKSQKKALMQAEKNLEHGKSLTLNELSRHLGFKD